MPSEKVLGSLGIYRNIITLFQSMPYDATPFVTSLGPQALALPNHPDRHGHSVPVPPVAPVAPSPNFWWWLSDETRSRPDEAQLPKVPRSHLE